MPNVDAAPAIRQLSATTLTLAKLATG